MTFVLDLRDQILLCFKPESSSHFKIYRLIARAKSEALVNIFCLFKIQNRVIRINEGEGYKNVT